MLAIVLASPVGAQDQNSQERVAAHGDWAVFVDPPGGTCWVATRPFLNDPETELPLLMVSLFAERPDTPELSYFSDVALNEDHPFRIRISTAKWSMLAREDVAWLLDADEQSELTVAMRTGDTMALIGRAADGAPVGNTFSLSGFGAALDDATSRCAALPD